MGAAHTKKAILDAAEATFAASGYEGASMRAIAERANVTTALIHYHFDTKDRLYEEIFARRSGAINADRERRLAACLGPDESRRPALEELVDALFRPVLELGHDPARGGAYFARILVGVANSGDPRSVALVRKHYDPIARKFITAFKRALPELADDDAVWGYLFSIGVGMTSMARTGRAAVLSDGLCDDGEVDALVERIVPFIVGGLRALAGAPRTTRAPAEKALDKKTVSA